MHVIELSIVIPFYNEIGSTESLIVRTERTMKDSGISGFEALFVNNGSTPEQSNQLYALARRFPFVRVLTLSRNFGYQGALWAGLDAAKGAAVAFMDGDGEDPPEVLAQFIEKWRRGAHVVYGVRRTRQVSWFMSFCYRSFYRTLARWSRYPIPLDAGEFSLISGPALEAIRRIGDRTRMLRILRAWVGYRQVAVEYDRLARIDGKSKFSFLSAFMFAWDGFVAATDIPVRLAVYLTLFCSSLAVLGTFYYLVWYFVAKEKIPGFASLNITILFLFSALFLCVAVLAKYITTLLEETRKRPPYLIMEQDDLPKPIYEATHP